MIAANLPALQVVLPLVSAPLCLIFRNALVTWLLALAVSWAALAIALALLHQAVFAGPISYALGNWASPWGIEYRIDALNAFLLFIVAAVSSAVLPFCRRSVPAEIEAERIHLFYAAYLLCLTGLLGISATGDAFNVFVFLEIASLSSYVLVSLGPDRRALTAAYNYLVLGTIGATFILIGIGLAYMVTGTLNMADLATRLPALGHNRTVYVGLAFLVVGLCLKFALFPLHLWLPNAYGYAPSAVSAFLAATSTKVSLYVLLRFVFSVFGPVVAFHTLALDWVLPPLAILAMFVGSLVAVFQDDVKRMLAYSSIAQIGYIVLGISFLSVDGLTGAVVHLFNHAITKGGMFLALGCVFFRLRSTQLRALRGLGHQMPLTAAALVVGGLGLVGIPLTAGFVSKWYLALAAIAGGWWIASLLILGSSLIALLYVWRIVEMLYFEPAGPNQRAAVEAPPSMVGACWILIGASLYFGIDSRLPLGVARRAAESLLAGG